MNNPIAITTFFVILIGILILLYKSRNKKKLLREKLAQPFPEQLRNLLQQNIRFYSRLNDPDKTLFEKRIQRFLATKNIEGIDTEIDDTIRLMAASSAIIPTFAFPGYNYPNVQTVLIYPNSFDEKFQTQRFNGHKEFISGMVGNRFMEGTVILSRPDLVKAFDGSPHKSNVGIHEFIHLLDKEDGVIDGIPKILMENQFVGPWLHEIKKEISRIEKGHSDINLYALTSNAEFLAVVSEYFFDNQEKFQKRHPELYHLLSIIFNTDKNTARQIVKITKE
ncbi:MAG: zinc-dependent peptidase [Bacteroidia bacterium]|nr:zinc-dependent peptidase [Bacteroidia bacterium]